MSFLLSKCVELNYKTLMAINGGCVTIKTESSSTQTFVDKVDAFFKGLGDKKSEDKKSGDSGNSGNNGGSTNGTSGSGSGGSGSGGSSSNSVSATSSTCVYTNQKKEPESIPTVITKRQESSMVNTVSSSSGNCTGQNISYVSQHLLQTSDYAGAEAFDKEACGATSILNEVSEQYTRETGKVMTEQQAKDAMKKAISDGWIRGTDAYVNGWAGAANSMSKSLGLKGTWKDTSDPSKATAVIISIDTETENKPYNGYHDHFVNDIGGGKYYDPWTNKIGNISDLHLTTAWPEDSFIKSAYRLVQYEA